MSLTCTENGDFGDKPASFGHEGEWVVYSAARGVTPEAGPDRASVARWFSKAAATVIGNSGNETHRSLG